MENQRMTKMTRKTTSGFTLVELSIVLVIIGLIIGGVLSGKQLMLNAQITNAVNSVQAYQAQFQTYVQNYAAMPGDDANAQTRFSDAGIPGKTDKADGTLDDSFDSSTDTDETRLAWSNLRAAGLVKGAGSSTAQPSNPFGGIYGFQHGAFTTTGAFTTNVVCLSNVPGDAAMSIDSRLDDGAPNSGAVAAATTITGEPPAAYGSSTSYILCAKM
jgi:prepilin-type N-terminal cleavage/methylation domain-containing protein